MDTRELSTLLNKEFTRKEFILYLFAILLALSGINSIVKTILNPSHKTVTPGFGFGPYGGRKINK